MAPPGSGQTLVATYTIVPANAPAWFAKDGTSLHITLDAGNLVRNTRGTAIEPQGILANFQILIFPTLLDFGSGGSAALGFSANDSVSDASGATLLAGTQGTGDTSAAAIERLTPDGQPDPTFGSDGTGAVLTKGTGDTYLAVANDGRPDHCRRQQQSAFPGRPLQSRWLPGFSEHPRRVRQPSRLLMRRLFPRWTTPSWPPAWPIPATRWPATAPTAASIPALATGALCWASSAGAGVGRCIAIDAQGRIIAAGASAGQVVVFRLNSDGTPDSTFNKGQPLIVPGLAAEQNGINDPTEGLALEGDQILVANHTADGHFGVARVKADGSVDNTFGQNGIATAVFNGIDDADRVVVEPSGQIVATGTTATSTGIVNDAVAAFLPSGAPTSRSMEQGSSSSIPRAARYHPRIELPCVGSAARRRHRDRLRSERDWA